MEIFLTHTTAALFWAGTKHPLQGAKPRRLQCIPSNITTPDASQLDRLRQISPQTPVIDVMVRSTAAKRNVAGYRTHYATTGLPPNAFIPLTDDVMMATPELCLLQLAATLPALSWIRLAYALCGTYLLDADGKVGHRDAGVTSVSKLMTFLEQAGGHHGAKKARRQLAHVLDGSDSPMETRMNLQVHFPKAKGGYLLPHGEMNRRFELGPAGRQMAGKRFYKADLCWPEQRVVVEYDSDAYHTGSSRIAADSRRRNVWLHLGYTPITVTRPQLLSVTEFDCVARQLHKALGKSYRRAKDAQWHARVDLHRQLSVPLRDALVGRPGQRHM